MLQLLLRPSLLAFSVLAAVVVGQVPPLNTNLAFSTYLGGSGGDSIRDVAVDGQGYSYVTGGTGSADFPATVGAFDTSYNGGGRDVFVAKLAPDGALVWATFLGGPNYDRAYAIEVDGQGYVYAAGRAGQNFPTTPGALQTAFNGDVNPNPHYGQQDGFIAKISADGSTIVWSTYFGGSGRDFVRDIALDPSGDLILGVSEVDRSNPHVTAGAFQSSLRGPADGIIARLSADGRRVIHASYFGGSTGDGYTPSVRSDDAGNAYFLTFSNSSNAPVTAGAFQKSCAGSFDMMLAKISPAGVLLYSTYLGGSGNEFSETHGLAVDAAGNAWVAATTTSTDLPTTGSAFQKSYGGSGGPGSGAGTNYPGDGFVARLSPNGSSLLACTYLGGSRGEGLEGIGLDSAGLVYVSGGTYSSDFPVTANASRSQNGGQADFFLAVLSADLSRLDYGTYLGGRSVDVGRCLAVSADQSFMVGGEIQSDDWPSLNPFLPAYRGNTDGALAAFRPPPAVPNRERHARRRSRMSVSPMR
ncbi:MAG: SBBP repeat-containing protein [Acidobacteriota bacterium]